MKSQHAFWGWLAFGILALLASSQPSYAVVFTLLHDPFDTRQVIDTVQKEPQVKAFMEKTEGLKKKLHHLKEHHIIALFGKPVAMPKDFAMLCSEPRVVAFSGLRNRDPKLNKDHVEFHIFDDSFALEVYYGIDGVTPSLFLFYRKTNQDFTKLTDPQLLKKRLPWDEEGFQKIERHYETQRRKIFQWEIDLDQAKKLNQGFDSADFDQKLAVWIKWGEEQGFTLVHRPAAGGGTPKWEWFDEKKLLMASVTHNRGFKGAEGKPCSFMLFHSNGEPQYEAQGWPSLESMRWQNRERKNIRFDGGSVVDGLWRPTSWTWWNEKGNVIHYEQDDNQDGVPDLVSSGEKQPMKPLMVEDSWAIHPDLIPDECRVPNQEKYRVPIRKIPPLE